MAAATSPTRYELHHFIHTEKTPEKAPEAMDKVKTLAGQILFGLGLALLTASFFALGGVVIGAVILDTAVVQTLFTCSMMSVVGGYYLANPTKVAGFTLKGGDFADMEI